MDRASGTRCSSSVQFLQIPILYHRYPVMLSAPLISDILDDQGWVKNKNMCWSTMVCLPGVPIGTERFFFWMWRRNNRCTPMLDTPWPVGFRSGVGGGPCFSLNVLFSLVQSSHLIESSLHQPFPTEAAALTNRGFLRTFSTNLGLSFCKWKYFDGYGSSIKPKLRIAYTDFTATSTTEFPNSWF